jgi:hypothetical protein
MWHSLNWNKKSFFKRKLKDGKRVDKWPLIVAMDHELTGGHYVTVVDIETDGDLSTIAKKPGSLRYHLHGKKCDVIYNTWQDQYRLPCTTFAYWASFPNKDIVSKLSIRYEIIDLIQR